MEFLKKNYEKVLLGVVLLGLTIGAAVLPIMISKARKELDDKSQTILERKIEPLPGVDLSRSSNLLQRVQVPVALNLSRDNKLFNPVTWQKVGDHWVKQPAGGMSQLCQITKLNPLYTIVTLDNVQVSDTGARYVIGVEREAATNPALRRKKQYYTSKDQKTEAFMVRDVKGPAENPVELILDMNDTGETISVGKDKPFRREDGYTADLKYPPENKSWSNQRIGSIIAFGGETYSIVAISKDEVVISAKSNNKKTPISYSPAVEAR